MAQRIQTILIDDLDGSELGNAGQTIQFGWLGVEYKIDLSQTNVDKFAEAITPYVEKAERIGGRKGRSSSGATSNGQVDTKAVRAWAASNGVELSSRGRIPADVIAKYREAGN